MYEFAVTPAVTQLRRPGVTISAVTTGSLAEELELAPNDRIVKVNGRTVRDYLDFRFQTAGEADLIFQVRKPNGQSVEIEFDREEGEDFGLEFEQIVPRQCANECIFCFCKGNPDDARPSLFVRDEDIRLSFLYGNYTTLTSITDDEMDRIIEQRLSPQYVSVHATDLKTRAYLLGVDENRADISEKLDLLLENDIEIHAQVVLCPEINDGAILEKTVRDLAAHYPKVISTAIVPVALTRYNTDERLTPVTAEFCLRTIRDVEKLQKEFRKTLGTTFAFLGDEIYIKAGARIPSRRHYGDYPQIEDGVGMVRSFLNEFAKMMNRRYAETPSKRELSEPPAVAGGLTRSIITIDQRTHPAAMVPKRFEHAKRQPPAAPTTSAFGHPSAGRRGAGGSELEGTILTGEMFAPILTEQIEKYNRLCDTRLHVLSVPNIYFGGDVAVAGLLTGQCLLNSIDNVVGDFVIIQKHTIKSDEPIFLDGMSFDELKRRFPIPVYDLDTAGLLQFLDR